MKSRVKNTSYSNIIISRNQDYLSTHLLQGIHEHHVNCFRTVRYYDYGREEVSNISWSNFMGPGSVLFSCLMLTQIPSRTFNSKPSYVMDKFLTGTCSPTEKLACTNIQGNKSEEASPHKHTEATSQYLEQWQSSWDAMGGAGKSS